MSLITLGSNVPLSTTGPMLPTLIIVSTDGYLQWSNCYRLYPLLLAPPSTGYYPLLLALLLRFNGYTLYWLYPILALQFDSHLTIHYLSTTLPVIRSMHSPNRYVPCSSIDAITGYHIVNMSQYTISHANMYVTMDATLSTGIRRCTHLYC